MWFLKVSSGSDGTKAWKRTKAWDAVSSADKPETGTRICQLKGFKQVIMDRWQKQKTTAKDIHFKPPRRDPLESFCQLSKA